MILFVRVSANLADLFGAYTEEEKFQAVDHIIEKFNQPRSNSGTEADAKIA